jgi:chemotaxis signal transduction protein
LAFRLGGQEFAIDSKRVKGIIPMHDMEAAEPGASDPPWLLGEASLRGTSFAVYDLGRWLKLARRVKGRNPCIVVVRGASLVGFPVDGVSGLLLARAHDFRSRKLRIGRPRRILDADSLFAAPN